MVSFREAERPAISFQKDANNNLQPPSPPTEDHLQQHQPQPPSTATPTATTFLSKAVRGAVVCPRGCDVSSVTGVFLCKCFKWLFTEEDLTVFCVCFVCMEEDLTGKSLAYFVDWDQICKDIGKQLICDQRTINLLRAWSPLIIEH
ncbi:hypothetical protein LXL04_016761 [Taraxacum kok-saghyz]